MCIAGCSSKSGNQTAKQGAGSSSTPPTTSPPSSSGAGVSVSNGGSCATCCPTFVIESQTVATQPGTRTRTKIGIGEEVELTVNPSQSVTWTIENDDGHMGKLSPASGTKTTYEAGDRAKTVTIKAENHCGNSNTILITVVEPSAGRFGPETDISAIAPPMIAVGFRAPPAIMPNDVSFYNCEMREGICMSTSSGVLQQTPEIQHADTGSWVPMTTTVDADGTLAAGNDTVRIRTAISTFPTGGTTDGHFSWPIPWRAQVRGGGTNGAIVFGTLTHINTYTASTRVLTTEKGNRNKQRTVP